MNIIESIHNKDIFLDSFDDLGTWGAWQVYLKALFGLKMTAAETSVYKKHTGCKKVPAGPNKISYVLSGRRSGKTFLCSLLSVFLSTYKNWSKMLSPGEQGYVFLVANDKDQARILKRYISGILNNSPGLKHLIRKELVWEIELNNRITIAVRTKNFRTLRGYTVIAAILEELCFWRSEFSANPDYEILAAIKPSMLTVKDSMLIGISSAYAKRGLLYDQYKRFYGKTAGPLIWKSSTVDMNPTVDKSIIAEQIKSDPAKYKSEYLSEFRGDIESYLGVDDLEKVTEKGVWTRSFDPNYTHKAFCDPSGGRSDSMTLAIGFMVNGYAVLSRLQESKPPFSPEDVVKQFSDTLKEFGISKITSDRFGGAWVEESFKNHGIQVEYSDLPASGLYLNFIPLVMNEKVLLLDSKKLRMQFANLERRTGSGGREIIDHPSGSNDDLCNSAAGLCYILEKPEKVLWRVW